MWITKGLSQDPFRTLGQHNDRGVMGLGRVAAALLAGLLLIAGCTAPGSGANSPEPGGPQPVDLEPYLTQQLAWKDCPASDRFLDAIPDGAECATAKVPVDYFDGGSKRGDIEIAMIRIVPQGPVRGHLLLNPGGPGASGFNQVAQAGTGLLEKLPGYALVGFDPRGVARSAPFDCRQSDRKRLDLIEADFTPEDAEEFEEFYLATSAYDEACRKAYPNWGFLGTSSVARDVYVISRALGDPGINFYGISYGSQIAYELLRLYPDGIDRLIIESPVDPSIEDVFPDQIAAFDAQLAELLRQCATAEYDAVCARGRDAEQVRAAFLEAAAAVEEPGGATLTASGGPSESLVFWGLALPLYVERDQALTDLYISALGALINDGDARQFEFWGYLYREYDYNTGEFLAADDIQPVVSCLDVTGNPASWDIAEERAKEAARLADIRQRAPLLAAVSFAEVYTGDDRAYEPCSYGRIAHEDPTIPDPLPEAAPVVNPGAVPVLLLGISGDTATPYAWAQAIAQRLGVPLVTQDTVGHGVYTDSDNACSRKVVGEYLATRQLPGAVTC